MSPHDQSADATPLLFTKLTLRGVTARNRLVLSPMVQYRARDGLPNDFHLVHLGRFAQGRMGIVFTESTAVEPRGRVTHRDCGIWNDEQMHAFRRITDYYPRGGQPVGDPACACRPQGLRGARDGRRRSTASGGHRRGLRAHGRWWDRPTSPSATGGWCRRRCRCRRSMR